MKILGGILILIGAVDLIGSFMGFDLWGGFIGIDLPELIWRFSAYILIASGFFIMKLGSSPKEETTEAK